LFVGPDENALPVWLKSAGYATVASAMSAEKRVEMQVCIETGG